MAVPSTSASQSSMTSPSTPVSMRSRRSTRPASTRRRASICSRPKPTNGTPLTALAPRPAPRRKHKTPASPRAFSCPFANPSLLDVLGENADAAVALQLVRQPSDRLYDIGRFLRHQVLAHTVLHGLERLDARRLFSFDKDQVIAELC